mmetsp:Transcript_22117/g.70670  ORF Transcript_22117/g.70670 Transcript_22117/m.70670 type:complete len:241 (-) Transcript_22117:91-813(-)
MLRGRQHRRRRVGAAWPSQRPDQLQRHRQRQLRREDVQTGREPQRVARPRRLDSSRETALASGDIHAAARAVVRRAAAPRLARRHGVEEVRMARKKGQHVVKDLTRQVKDECGVGRRGWAAHGGEPVRRRTASDSAVARVVHAHESPVCMKALVGVVRIVVRHGRRVEMQAAEGGAVDRLLLILLKGGRAPLQREPGGIDRGGAVDRLCPFLRPLVAERWWRQVELRQASLKVIGIRRGP